MFVYGKLRGLAPNLANKNQIENSKELLAWQDELDGGK